MIRPEVLASLRRWREALVAATAAGLALYWILSGGGALRFAGWALMLAALLGGYAGIQRGRFRATGDGPGIAQVREGQIAYFGPETGGIVALDLLEAVSLVTEDGLRMWRLDHAGGAPVFVPVDARGADEVFDLLAALPELGSERLLAALAAPRNETRLVWRRKRIDVARQIT